jgi:hypothetical protein
MNYRCYLISNKPEYFEKISKSLAPEKLIFFNGQGYPSFSKLVNECVSQSDAEIVILMSDKMLPTAEDIKKTVSLVEDGYAFVALYRFGFFGFKKELFRQIGCMDERYIGGGFEDDDFYIRLREANLSMYITEEVLYERRKSAWQLNDVNQHFIAKWGDIQKNNYITRSIPEERYNYNLGLPLPTSFKPWDQSFIKPVKVKKWLVYPIIREEK